MATIVTVPTSQLSDNYAFYFRAPVDFPGLAGAVMTHLNTVRALNLPIRSVEASEYLKGKAVQFTITPDQDPALVKANL